MFEGVTFGVKHSYHNYSLMLAAPPVVSPPVPREHWVTIPGMDGALDLSKVQTGFMQYEMRTIAMHFVFVGPRGDWPNVLSEILNDIHGKDMHITLDNDPDYYYDGIVKAEKYEPKQAHFGLSVICTVQPFKYARDGSKGGF